MAVAPPARPFSPAPTLAADGLGPADGVLHEDGLGVDDRQLRQRERLVEHMICVEDGIDSSKDSGKLMISVLSAVAEIERENILVQTMEGRKQKAREGKWNGGFAPYGYELVNGELQIAEDEAEVIRLIYDKFIHTNMGIAAIAIWLNQHGYKRKRDRIIHWMHLPLLL